MVDLITRLNAALEGRYTIERELGEGGMATVFLAKDLKHNRNVALWLRVCVEGVLSRYRSPIRRFALVRLTKTDKPALSPFMRDAVLKSAMVIFDGTS